MNKAKKEEIRTVLSSLKRELQTRPYKMDEHVLRAVRKLGLRDFDAILEEHVPGYKSLERPNEERQENDRAA